MSNTKGDIYFRDIHGNFHKLETKDLNNELLELAGFDNILTSNNTEKTLCNYNPLNYLPSLFNRILKPSAYLYYFISYEKKILHL